jgi:ABC-type sugar transport system ATPase subunit
MKVLSGVYPHGTYSGTITFEGEERRFRDISESEKAGIIIIHQELALVPLLSITENIEKPRNDQAPVMAANCRHAMASGKAPPMNFT